MSEDPTKYSVSFASWWHEYSKRWRESGNDYAAVLAGAKAGWDARGQDIDALVRFNVNCQEVHRYIHATDSQPSKTPPNLQL